MNFPAIYMERMQVLNDELLFRVGIPGLRANGIMIFASVAVQLSANAV